ncbi:hydroxymethylbilane synthase [Orrella sp. JC864]|uniref:hydroxymethylbilane synthase n=1 Tax=Orrella sp. JC864 TaxID=3120298 RepID=UPI0012BC2337
MNEDARTEAGAPAPAGPLRIGTRKSQMALRQAEAVAGAASRAAPALQTRIVARQAQADKDLKSRLSALGGKGGAFITAMREMMCRQEVDVAMHSLKDMPGNAEYYVDDRFVLGAFLPRDDPRDVLVLRKGLERLPAGAVIGTASVRRAAFARRLYPDATVVPFRGAADKRIERMDQGIPMQFNYGGQTPCVDALILAKSGLERLSLQHRISRVFSVGEMCPAAGQGIVVVEALRARADLAGLLAAISDRQAAYCAQAERAVLKALNGHCDSPIGCHAWIADGMLRIEAVVIAGDGKASIHVSDGSGFTDPHSLGARVGRRLNQLGAQQLLQEQRAQD